MFLYLVSPKNKELVAFTGVWSLAWLADVVTSLHLGVKSSFSMHHVYLLFLMPFVASICFERVSHILVLD